MLDWEDMYWELVGVICPVRLPTYRHEDFLLKAEEQREKAFMYDSVST